MKAETATGNKTKQIDKFSPSFDALVQLLDFHSFYYRNEFLSTPEFECVAGVVMAGVVVRLVE